MQRRLVVFDGQKVMPALLTDRRRDLSLTPHGINRDGGAAQVEQPHELRN